MQKLTTFYNVEDFVPELRAALEQRPLDFTKLVTLAVPVQDPKTSSRPLPIEGQRTKLALFDGTNYCPWDAVSLRALFRGDKQPPELGAHPQAYNDCFVLLDWHALEISRLFGDRRDAEMLEIYSALRRRPDGRSLGFVHDYMWQAAALVLATHVLSQAEFEAIMSRLERSCRTFQRGPTSRNYIATLRATLGRPQPPSPTFATGGGRAVEVPEIQAAGSKGL